MCFQNIKKLLKLDKQNSGYRRLKLGTTAVELHVYRTCMWEREFVSECAYCASIDNKEGVSSGSLTKDVLTSRVVVLHERGKEVITQHSKLTVIYM